MLVGILLVVGADYFEFYAAVLGAVFVAGVGDEGLRLAVSLGDDPRLADAFGDEVFGYGGCALVGELEVVGVGSDVVGVCGEFYLNVGVHLEGLLPSRISSEALRTSAVLSFIILRASIICFEPSFCSSIAVRISITS